MDLIYIELYIQKQQNTHSSTQGTVCSTDHMLGQKTSLKDLRKLKSYQASSFLATTLGD